jgi:methylmalonyl-CoA mutase N-terminal domain/subunit
MASIVLLSMYAMVAEELGCKGDQLRGTIQNDPLHARYCGYTASCPIDAGVKVAADVMHYCHREVPQFYTNNVNMYDLREHGITAAQELAFGFGLALAYIDAALEQGSSIEEATRRIAFYCSLHNDFLEEVAKLRAARLVWSKLLVERYGVDPESKAAHFRIGCQTAGSTLIPQQPLNNIVRIAYQAMAGVMAGVSSIHCCGFDDAIGLPSELAHKTAVRTQQILAYETGVAIVADPLGGSYYVESLTDRIARDSQELLAGIFERGGMLECVRDGWLEEQLAIASLDQVRAIEDGDLRVVGANWAVEGSEDSTPGGIEVFSMEVNDRRIREITQFKRERDTQQTTEALSELHRVARDRPRESLVPLVQGAIRKDATLGEIVGTIRVAYGLHYDPAELVESPFDLSA